MAIDEAIQDLLYNVPSDETIDIAIKALEEKKERESSEPLTIEQLLELDETPVFVRNTWDGSVIGRWAMVKRHPNFVTLRFTDGGCLYVESIKQEKIYKYPPVESKGCE